MSRIQTSLKPQDPGWDSSSSTVGRSLSLRAPNNSRIESQSRTRVTVTTSFHDVRSQSLEDIPETLNSLVEVLRENEVSGPQLFRLETEFKEILGQGAECTVHGLENSQRRRFARVYDAKPELKDGWQLSQIAIKKHQPVRVDITKPDLNQHLRKAKREIETLSLPSLRKHKNIVSLLGWGFCLDTAEQPQNQSLQIPLLVLERADTDLYQLLQRSGKDKLSLRHRYSVLLDIGSGLEALHNEQLVHGDLKPENVILFRNHYRQTWTTKLCDFGHARTDEHGLSSGYKYYGTTGWRPPEAITQDQKPLESGSLRKCDIFVYALVAWSVMLLDGRPPLGSRSYQFPGPSVDHPLQREHQTVKAFAADWLASSPWPEPLMSMKRAVADVLDQCLDVKPERRHAAPWQALEGWPVTLRRHLQGFKRQQEVVNSSKSSHAPQRHWADAIRLATRVQRMSTLLGSISRPNRHMRLSREEKCSTFSAARSMTSVSGNIETPLLRFNPQETQESPGCKEMPLLHEELHAHISRNHQESQLTIYALARSRATVKSCCWHGTCSVKASDQVGERANVLSLALQARPALEVSILAWLCQGPVGLEEVGKLEPTYQTWRNLLDSRYLSESERLERFLLLLQYGARIENSYEFGEGSLLMRFGDSIRHVNHGPAMREICSNFNEVKERSYINSETHHYMTGQGPPRSYYIRTILSDVVHGLNLAAAQEVVQAGFFLSSSTSRQLMAHVNEAVQSYGTREASALASGFLKLLGQRRDTLSLSASSDQPLDEVPLGWERIKIGSPEVYSYCYRDILSTSLTFRKPRFSLLEQRFVAVGFLNDAVQNETPQQQYMLDMAGFISPESVRDMREKIGQKMAARFPIYDDAWFKVECYNDEDQPDILGATPEPWRLPSVPVPAQLTKGWRLPSFLLLAVMRRQCLSSDICQCLACWVSLCSS